MGLYLRKGIYWFSISTERGRIRESTGTGNQKLAERIYAKKLVEVQEGRYFDNALAKSKTFEDMMEKYFEKIHDKPSTLERKESALPHLQGFFAGYRLIDISGDVADSYKKSRLEAGAADSTVRNEVNLLSHAFNTVKWRKDNPVRNATLIKLKPRKVERWLHPKEEGVLLPKAAGEMNGDLPDMILLDLNTGLSQEELLSLKWPGIDLSGQTLSTTRSKTLKARTIPLNSVALSVLKRRAAERGSSEYVFFNSAGNKHDAGKLKRVFKKVVDGAGIKDFTFHCLRHTFATRLCQAGVDIYTVSKLMGHEDVATTARYYAHHCVDSLRRGVEVLNPCQTLCHNSVTLPADKRAEFVEVAV